jgi:hypothetical protein
LYCCSTTAAAGMTTASVMPPQNVAAAPPLLLGNGVFSPKVMSSSMSFSPEWAALLGTVGATRRAATPAPRTAACRNIRKREITLERQGEKLDRQKRKIAAGRHKQAEERGGERNGNAFHRVNEERGETASRKKESAGEAGLAHKQGEHRIQKDEHPSKGVSAPLQKTRRRHTRHTLLPETQKKVRRRAALENSQRSRARSKQRTF